MKRLLSFAFIFLVLMTSANAARIFLIEGSGGCTGNCSAGTDGVGIRNATILSNGSLSIGLTNNTILILANITGAKGDTGPAGTSDGTGGWTNTSNVTSTTLNVGIGTTAPKTSLHVGSPFIANSGMITVQTTNGANAGISYLLFDNTTERGYMYWDTNEDLHLKGDKVDFTIGTNRLAMTIAETSGDVGIGKEPQSRTLDINGTLRIVNSSGSTLFDTNPSGNAGYIFNTGNNMEKRVYFSRLGSVSEALNIATEDSTTFIRTVQDETGSGVEGSLVFELDGGAQPMYQFRDNTSTSILTLLMNRNVGIGTTAPTRKLDVNGTSFFSNNISTAGTVRFTGFGEGISQLESTGTLYLKAGWDNGGNEDIILLTNTVARMIIKNGGNVGIGIGTGNPNQKLQVNGSINVSSQAYFYSNVTLSSPNGSLWNCGPSNTGVWSCS